MSILQILVICSHILYASAGTYISGSLGVIHFLLKVSFYTKMLIIWSTLALTLVSVACLYLYQYCLSFLKFVPLICLPWTIHLLFEEIRHPGDQRNALMPMIVPIVIMQALCLYLHLKLFPFFDSHSLNRLLTLQNTTNILQLIRLLVNNCLVMWLQGFPLYFIFACINLLITGYKITKITYLHPSIQYASFVIDSWSWISLSLAIFMSDQDPKYQILLQLLILAGLLYLVIRPSPEIMNLFQMKILRNIASYNKNNPLYSQIILVSYYSKVFLDKNIQEKSFSSSLSISFIFFIKNQIKNQGNALRRKKSLENGDDQGQKIYESENYSRNLEQFVNERKMLEICFQKDQLQALNLIYQLLIERKILTNRYIYQLFKYLKKNEKSMSFLKKNCLLVCYRQLYQGVRSMKGIGCTRSEELIGFQKIGVFLTKFSQNQLKRASFEEASNAKLKNYLDRRQKIKNQIDSEMRSLKIKNKLCLKMAYIDFFVEKFVKSKPRTANLLIRNMLQQIASQNSSLTFKSSMKQEKFVSKISQQNMNFVHCNSTFRVRPYEDKEGRQYEQIFGQKFIVETLQIQSEEIASETSFQAKNESNQLETKEQTVIAKAEAMRDKLDPLVGEFKKYRRMILFVFTILLIGVALVFYNLMAIMRTNSRMNNIQNQFYRFVLFDQVYLPTILCNYQLEAMYLSQNDLEVKKQKILQEISFIAKEHNDFLANIFKLAEDDTAVISDLFEVIPQKINSKFGHKNSTFQIIFQNFQLQFQTLAHSFSNEGETQQQQVLLSFLVESIRLVHILQQEDSFQIIESKLSESNSLRLINRYIGFYLIMSISNSFIAFYILWNIHLSKKLENFLRRSQLSSHLGFKFWERALELKSSLSLLRRNQLTEQNQRIKTISKVKRSRTQYLNKDKFYNYKPTLILGVCCLLFTYFTLAQRIKLTSFPKIIFYPDEIYKSKLTMTRIFADSVHIIEEISIGILHEQNVWPQLFEEHQLDEATHEIDRIKSVDMMQALQNFMLGHQNMRSTQNPCDEWIDCSYLQKKYGEQTDGLIVAKNKIYILLKQIELLGNKNTTYIQFSSKQALVEQVLKHSHKMINIINELFKLDTRLNTDQIRETNIKCYEMLLLVLVLFTIVMGEYMFISH